MTTIDRTNATDTEFAERIAAFNTAARAPETDDSLIWETLSDLIPCAEFGDCGDECECVQGELRLALQRLIVAERIHAADCEGDECCAILERRARLVRHAGNAA